MIVLPAVYMGVYFVLMKELGVDENRPVTSLPVILWRYRTCNSKFFSSDFIWVTIFQISGIIVLYTFFRELLLYINYSAQNDFKWKFGRREHLF